MKTSLFRMITTTVVLALPGLLTHADESHPTAAATRVLPITHLWADANGVSHFRDEKLSFEAANAGEPHRRYDRAHQSRS